MRLPKEKRFPRNFWITAGMSLFAALLFALFPSKHRLLALFAMILSSLGDLALMNFEGVFDRIRLDGFVTGGVLFILSHLTYAASYASLLGAHGLSVGGIGLGAAMLLWSFTFVCLTGLSVKRKRFGRLKTLLFACYLTAICTNAASIFSASVELIRLSPTNAGRALGAAGILLFWLSDFCIGLDRVAGIPDYGWLIWRTYVPGQLLILLAA